MTNKAYSKISDLHFKLHKYDFYHSPSDPNNKFFLGRKNLKERLKIILQYSNSTTGAYLVTGYRGMGKTSLVREVLNELKGTKNPVPGFHNLEVIEISLSQDDVRDMDFLRQIARQLFIKWSRAEWRQSKAKKPKLVLNLGPFFLLLSILYGIIFSFDLARIDFNNLPDLANRWGSVIPIVVTPILVLLIWKFKLFQRSFIKRNSHAVYYAEILEQLVDLNNRLFATVTKETEDLYSMQANIGNKAFSQIVPGRASVLTFQRDQRRKNIQNYSVATSKEVEKELVDIFNLISQYRIGDKFDCDFPRFIIVVDELDKVEPNFMTDSTDDEIVSSVDSGYSENKNLSRSRKRQKAVDRLLANTKSFLNSAKAQFIFIGGREMFDASLADIADRESFYSSIFNDVIYAKSFFKDKISRQSGITEMAEAFICQYLIPESRDEDDNNRLQKFTLAEYVNYCTGTLKLKQAELSKVVFHLQSFIIFLTFRSNGSPKKMIEVFEKYIFRFTSDYKEEAPFSIVIGKPSSDSPHAMQKEKPPLYLRFTFRDQYEIGVTSNLYRPYLIIHSRHLKMLGDKLLYSTAFMMDHLLKFHKQAFSWRNLELIPDIILVNKDPNLRYFLDDILSFLFKMHIRKTVNAIFQFKYYKKVTNELRYLSKVSEFSSAAFNFTLDELLHLKNHYKRKLRAQASKFNARSQSSGAGDFVHSLGYLNSILGDLYYYDEEFDDAIIHYSDAIQILRSTLANGNRLSRHQSVLYMRNKLKLGLCLEKIKAYDSAYSIYRSLILQVGSIVNSEEQVEKDKKGDNLTDREVKHHSLWEKPYRRMQLFSRPHIALLDVIEKQRTDGITYGNLKRNIEDYCLFLGVKKRFPAIPYSKPDYNDLTLEKKESDSKRIQTLLLDYYNNVGSLLFYKNKNFVRLHQNGFNTLLSGEFTGVFPTKDDFVSTIDHSILDDTLRDELNENLKVKTEVENVYNFTKHMCTNNSLDVDLDLLSCYSPSISSYLYYRASLKDFLLPYEENFSLITFNLVEKKLEAVRINDFCKALLFLSPEASIILNSTQYYVLGNLLSKLGDASLAICSKYSVGEIDPEIINAFVNPSSKKKLDLLIGKLHSYLDVEDPSTSTLPKNFFHLNLALCLYLASSMYYAKADKLFSEAFQFKKLLYVIKDYLTCFGRNKLMSLDFLVKQQEGPEDEILIEKIGVKIFRTQTHISGVSNRAQILKYRDVLRGQEEYNFTPHIYTNLTTAPEVREAILLVEEIKLKLYRLDKIKYFAIKPGRLLNSHDTISNMFERMLELKYQCEYNFNQALELLDYQNGKDLFKDIGNKKFVLKLVALFISNKEQELRFLIGDSIFALREIIRTLNTYGINYITNYSFLANAHYKLANWCSIYLAYKSLAFNESILNQCCIDQEIATLIGVKNLSLLEPFYHNDLAVAMYRKSIQMHTEGVSYKNVNEEMHFLDDDYNDNLTHFCTANERFRINNDAIRTKILALENMLKESKVNHYQSYLNFQKLSDENKSTELNHQLAVVQDSAFDKKFISLFTNFTVYFSQNDPEILKISRVYLRFMKLNDSIRQSKDPSIKDPSNREKALNLLNHFK